MNGKPVTISSPKHAIELGIGMVHQHFMLIPVMTVAENIVLASEPTHGGVLLDYAASVERVRELSERFGPRFDRIMEAGTVIVDGEPAGRERILGPDDEVALLPPVSGGS